MLETFAAGIALGQAIEHHRCGRLDEAASLYRRILDAVPAHPDALHLLGLVASTQGRHREAVSLIGQAVTLDPSQPVYLANLGLALGRQGSHQEAAGALRRSLALRPCDAATLAKLGRALLDSGQPQEAIEPLGAALSGDYEQDAPTWNALGRAFAETGRTADGETCFRRALIADAACGEAWHNLGQLAFARGVWEEAAEPLRRATVLLPGEALPRRQLFETLLHLGARQAESGAWPQAAAAFCEAARVQPDSADAFFQAGVALSISGEIEASKASYAEAIRLDPGHVRAHNNLSNLLTGAGEPDEAIAHLRRAIEGDPDYWEAHYNLGIALADAGHAEQALACYDEVLRLRPGHADTRNNIAGILLSRGKAEEAIRQCDEALAIAPDHIDAAWNKALAQLTLGDFENGWRGYESRLRHQRFAARRFPVPRWQGEDPAGKRILVWAEQGLGDTLQFLRYLPLLAARGAAVTFECHDRLLPLIRHAATGAELVGRGQAGAEFDFHVPLLSLPLAFDTRLDTIPPPGPAIALPEDLLSNWRAVTAADGGRRRIGVCWQGNRHNYGGRRRSMPAATMARLAEAVPARWFSLQPDEPVPPGFEKPEREGCGLDGTAAIVSALDLVISVDTMVAHLAGLLGRPVWTLLPYGADWRWMLGRDNSPWYPSMRLWRQQRPDDWDGVIDRLAAALGPA